MNGFTLRLSNPRVAVLLVTILVTCGSVPAFAQQPSGFLRRIMDNYIDSQLPRDPVSQPGQSGQPRQQQNVRPGQQRHALPQNASPQMREASRLLTLASDEMDQLVGSLENDIYRSQGVRQLLSLAINVNSDAAVLARRMAYATDVESLREPLRKLDQDWHTLEYRLGQTPNLSRQTVAHIERIRQHESQLASMFEVTTQIDLPAINQQAVQMNGVLRSLLQDIRYEISDSVEANRLLQEGRNTYDRLQDFMRTTQTASVRYDEVKRNYEVLAGEWTQYERQLRVVNNRFVQRQVQRINDHGRQINALLYVEQGNQVSREDLARATQMLQGDLDLLMRKVNLKMLSELPTARRFAIDAASELSTSCQDLIEIIQAGDDIEVVRDTYMFVHDEWERMSMSLQGVSSQPARQALRDAERSLMSLESLLGIKFDFDRGVATDLATALLSNSRNMQTDIRDFFARPNRYPREFQTNSLQAAAQFQAAARRLQQGLANGDKLKTLKTNCESLSNSWQALNQYLPRFSSNEQAYLDRIRRELTPQVVQMQTLLAL